MQPVPMRDETTPNLQLHELIRARVSPRFFAPRPVDLRTLALLFEAARWAPSSFNEQPWGFVFAIRDDRENFDRIFDCLVPGNQTWAHSAAVLMISVARLAFTNNAKPNRHAIHDVGLASATMTLQATALGLGVHMMSGFDVAKTRTSLAIPDGFEPVAAMALGYPESHANMPEKIRERALAPRHRKPLGDFIFQGRWGDPGNLGPVSRN